MTELLFELPLRSAATRPDAPALRFRSDELTYRQVATLIDAVANGLIECEVGKLERVAVYLPKRPETVATMFGAARAGCVFVPVNPLLKPAQVAHILDDSKARVLVTLPERLAELTEVLASAPSVRVVVLVDTDTAPASEVPARQHLTWSQFARGRTDRVHRVVDADMVSLLYTSGSTGRPKGVVLSHKNMVTGAHSVARYLGNTPEDRLLAVLPLSFDYGFSQLSTAFHTGASVTLMDYLFPRDILALLKRDRVTGLAGVPPLWAQLADLEWPAEIAGHLRYITNSGGAMPRSTLDKLRRTLPRTRPFLMYGLTEAFRSTFLDPDEVDRRPDSIGKAIPNAEVLVVRPDGTPCDADEPGELVHRGSLVALGYWNDPEKTAQRFRPVPQQDPGLVMPEMAVWSGDTVRRDAEGFLYYVGRRDEMIKTSGNRVSPTEVEEVLYATGLVGDAVAVGVPHPTLGQMIVAVVSTAPGREARGDLLLEECRKRLPLFMVPAHVVWRESLPRNPNGKFDRPRLATELTAQFSGAAS